MRMSIFVFILMFSSGSGALHAYDNPLIDQIKLHGHDERLNTDSLDAREISESPDRDIDKDLSSLAGVNIKREGAAAGDLYFRGFRKDNINVLVDGVRINGACPDRMDPPLTHYDFDQLDHIKIIKGPYDLTSFGGMAATINAVSRKPANPLGRGLALTCGSYDSLNVSADTSFDGYKMDGILGYDYKVSGVPTDGKGRLITDIYDTSNPARYRPDTVNSNAYEINSDWVKFGFKPTENSRFGVDYSYQDASHVLYPYLAMDSNYDRTTIVNLSYRVEKVSALIKNIKVQVFRDWVFHVGDDSLRESGSLGGASL
jgi:iron complex outermembrane receptor protein